MAKNTNVVNVTNNVAPTTEKTYTLNVKIDGVENFIEYGLHTKNRILGEASGKVINNLKDKQVCVIYNDTHSVKFIATKDASNNRSLFKLSVAKFITVNQGLDVTNIEDIVKILKVTPLLESYYKDNKAIASSKVNLLTFKKLEYTNLHQEKKLNTTSVKAIEDECKASNVDIEIAIRKNKQVSSAAKQVIAMALVSAGVGTSQHVKFVEKLQQKQLAASNK